MQICRIGCIEVEDARVQHRSLLQGGSNGPVQSVLQVQVTLIFDDMGEQVTEEGRVLCEQGFEVDRTLRGDELREPHLAWRETRPLGHTEAMFRVWTLFADCLENHGPSICLLASGSLSCGF